MGCDGYIEYDKHPIFYCYICRREVTKDNHEDHEKCIGLMWMASNKRGQIPVIIEGGYNGR